MRSRPGPPFMARSNHNGGYNNYQSNPYDSYDPMCNNDYGGYNPNYNEGSFGQGFVRECRWKRGG